MRPRVKICGVTRAGDVEAILALGADMIGLNFYPGSPRCLDTDAASELRRRVGDRARVVGVFVNATAAGVRAIDARVGLDLLQFHGDEDAAFVAGFGSRAIKVMRVGDSFDAGALVAYPEVWGFLFDNGSAGDYGGSGTTWRFEAVADLRIAQPHLVAGGIGPDNVREVCRRCRPWGVDLSSGVESAPGEKDPRLLERLFEEIDDVEDAQAS
ncbi:MAG: phosphoribosylanthranilate isomerase [Thermoanaerobaculia bacterium]|nr:phosphoribosylanthranilate isomerase [Thermoanaerobaculia bacterium]